MTCITLYFISFIKIFLIILVTNDFASKGSALEKVKSSNFSSDSSFATSLLSNIAPETATKLQESIEEPILLDQQQIESASDADLMPWAKTCKFNN